MASPEYPSLSGPKRLGDRLLEAGLIRRSQLDVALDRQQEALSPRPRLGRALVDLGFLADRDLTQMLSVHFGIPLTPFAITDVEDDAVRTLTAEVARRHRAIPCKLSKGSLLVAVADAVTPTIVEELQDVSGLPVRLYLAAEDEVETALVKHYGQLDTPALLSATEAAPSIVSARLRELGRRLSQLADGHERLARMLETAAEESRKLADDYARVRAELEAVREESDAPPLGTDRSGRSEQRAGDGVG